VDLSDPRLAVLAIAVEVNAGVVQLPGEDDSLPAALGALLDLSRSSSAANALALRMNSPTGDRSNSSVTKRRGTPARSHSSAMMETCACLRERRSRA
jgi:hypothetical protein